MDEIDKRVKNKDKSGLNEIISAKNK